MKKILLILSVVLAFVACNKNPQPGPDPAPQGSTDVRGEWELVSVETKSADLGGVSISVYLKFAEGSFDIYQLIGEGRPRHYAGSYSVNADGVLSGKYSDGKSLGSSYEVSVTGSQLTMKAVGGSETDTYRKTTIPSTVINESW